MSLDGPRMESIPDKTILEGETLAFNAVVSDPNLSDSLTFDLVGGPADAQLNPQTGLFSWTPLDGPAVAVVKVRVSNNGYPKLVDERSFTITVNNVAPSSIVVSTNPSTINEDGTTTLSGSFVDPGTLDIHAVRIDWGDGSTPTKLDLAAGVLTIPPTDHQYLDNRPGNVPYAITVTVTDKDGDSGTGNTQATVNNVVPTLQPITGNTVAVRGQPLCYSALFADAGTLDTHTATLAWGDGSSTLATIQEAQGSGSASGSHAYTASGTYAVVLTVTDEDGASATKTLVVTVGAAAVEADPLSPGQNALFVGATPSDDHIQITTTGNANQLQVRIDSADPKQSYRQAFTCPFSRIVVYGGAGNDHIEVEERILTPAWLFGGDGNDHLQAGSGPSVLIGGDGDDHLQGGKGRSLLIGGKGSDQIEGGPSDGILIGSYTDYDANEAALGAIMAEWVRVDANYQQRLERICGSLAPARTDRTSSTGPLCMTTWFQTTWRGAEGWIGSSLV